MSDKTSSLNNSLLLIRVVVAAADSLEGKRQRLRSFNFENNVISLSATHTRTREPLESVSARHREKRARFVTRARNFFTKLTSFQHEFFVNFIREIVEVCCK